MGLSEDLINQFVKITNDDQTPKTDNVVYGTVVSYSGKPFVRLDGSDQLTPVSTTADLQVGDRVKVTIGNHTATVTGNVSSPSARKDQVDDIDGKVDEIGNQITEFEIVIADKVSVKELEAERGRIDELVSDNIIVKEKLTATEADIGKLEADNVIINETLTAQDAYIQNLDATKISAEIADLNYAKIKELEATNANIHNLQADYGEFKDLTTDTLAANIAAIKDLDVSKLDAESADLKYANIDFSNIGEAAVEKLFSESGIIRDLIVSEGKITGELVGVTIKGDLIEGGTVIADKLVVKGEDGLYYKLNTDGVTTEAEQTDYNSLNGSIITAKSITATKIAVDDLVAFDATIGGFNITESAIYSGVKASADNTTRGVYLDKEGQFSVGDMDNFIKYYKDENGAYRLVISAESLMLSASGKDIIEAVEGSITSSVEEFYLSSSPITLSGGKWSSEPPAWENGKYIWRRTAVTYGDGSSDYQPNQNGVCITGNSGADGKDGAKGEPGVDLTQGKMLFTDPMFLDGVNGVAVYNNSNNGTVTIARSVKSSDNPMSGATHELVIKNTGTSSPGCGGFRYANASRANAVFVYRIIAKLPSGRYLNFHSNAAGDGRKDQWLTSQQGTGKFTEYLIKVTCGSSGIFSTTGFFSLSGNYGTESAPVTWNVAYATCFDMTDYISMATSDEVNAVDVKASNAAQQVIETKSSIELLKNSIASLVTDQNGTSLMTQTSGGWTFNIGAIQSALDKASNDINTMQGSVNEAKDLVNKTNQLANDIAKKTAYINMATDASGNPCIELGKVGNEFKVRITNTSIDFMQGSQRIAYLTNQKLYIQSAVTTDDLKIGDGVGWVWKKRSNNNLGLRYVTS